MKPRAGTYIVRPGAKPPIVARPPAMSSTTGIIDAALGDVAVLRKALDTGGRMPQRDRLMTERLDRIEAALLASTR